MRLLRLLPALLIGLVLLMVLETGTSYAVFHCMRIHAVMAGFQGDGDIQYVELRMSAAGQSAVSGHTIRFYDGSDTLKATFTFPSIASTSSNGSSILIGTSEFDAATNGGNADFVFSGANTVASNGGDPLRPIQSPGGRVVWAGEGGDFNCNSGPAPVDSVAYGTATADFGSAAVALPSPSDDRALRVNNLNTKPSNNSTEYSLEDVATSTFIVATGSLKSDASTPRNNDGVVLELLGPVGGIAEVPGVDSTVLDAPSDGGGSSRVLVAIGAGVAAAIFVTAGAWYARRRIVARASWWDEQT